MSEYLVRWKFGSDSLLNSSDTDTSWYQAFHPNKHFAVKHYSDLLYHSSPAMKLTAEIFQLVQLVPGQSEPENQVEEKPIITYRDRNMKMMKMYNDGKTRREIADAFGLSYQTVYGVTRKFEQ